MANPVRTVIKLIVASLIVGWILKLLNLDAQRLLEAIGGFLDSLVGIFAGIIDWSLGPIAVGALVVIPIWIIRIIWKKAVEKSPR